MLPQHVVEYAMYNFALHGKVFSRLARGRSWQRQALSLQADAW